jgi:tetraacyldisaccharide 4'-kinase
MDFREIRKSFWPLSVIYEVAARLRANLYLYGVLKQRRLDGTVISVGNLTVGGTGKTPMVIWLAEKLIAQGERPAILTRGYRGEAPKNDGGLPGADEVALMVTRLRAKVQLGVGKDRYASGRVLERHGAKYFILDDGFQHLRLHRDADVVLLDATDPFGGGKLLPGGGLREPLSALGRASVVVITRSDHAPAVESLVKRNTAAPIFYARAELQRVLRAPALAVEWPLPDRASARVFAFCGIGNSRAFFDDLRQWGFSVVGERSFRDHHRYSPEDLAALERAARDVQADAMICTEKDVFNLRDAGAGTLPVYACRIGLAVEDGDKFWDAVMSAARQRQTVKRG